MSWRHAPTSVATAGTPAAKPSSSTSGSASLIDESTTHADLRQHVGQRLEAEELHLVLKPEADREVVAFLRVFGILVLGTDDPAFGLAAGG